MDTFELFQRLSVALAVGLLIGLERGWRERKEGEGGRTAGLRTFALSGLLGGVWAAIAKAAGDGGGAIALGLAFAVHAAILAVFRYRENVRDGTFGATTIVAAMLTFALGALAVFGPIEAAAAGGVATAGLLAWKSVLHQWLQRMTREELRSGLVLLAMTFILLPLLPQRTVDPWDALNPYEIWLMTIMIAFISFVGYVAVKLTGDRHGIAITGIAGGLASSTAVTMTLAQVARENPEQRTLLTAGVLLASAVMSGRVLAIAGVINPSLLTAIALPIGAIGAVLACGAVVLMWRSADGEVGDGTAITLKNPFELATVLKFGAVLAIVLLATRRRGLSRGGGIGSSRRRCGDTVDGARCRRRCGHRGDRHLHRRGGEYGVQDDDGVVDRWRGHGPAHGRGFGACRGCGRCRSSSKWRLNT